MLSVLIRITAYLFFLYKPYHMKIIWKPPFSPYCSEKEICRSDCDCISSPNCTLLQLDDKLRNHILFFLNNIRDIQSLSSGMSLLQYDEYLEKISMCWASKCIDDYSECFLTSRFRETSQSVGQLRLEQKELPARLWKDVIYNWLGGMEILNAEISTTLPEGLKGAEMHNLGQIMSDQVLFVGCSWSAFGTLVTFVCTYGPRGPHPGETISRPGSACSKCPNGYKCDHQKPFTNLCKPQMMNLMKSLEKESLKNFDSSSSRSKSSLKEKKLDKAFGKFVLVFAIALISVVAIMVAGFSIYYMIVV
ncbi:hypothetical protein HHI36_012447 [Cryptolaemus montrouzieri]|uniref:SCP domain-containing protein n=1 Tax=Cryptolaemus montrouzieri TaxID=559131 RepID=A0ABD2NEV1_9CUCU